MFVSHARQQPAALLTELRQP